MRVKVASSNRVKFWFSFSTKGIFLITRDRDVLRQGLTCLQR